MVKEINKQTINILDKENRKVVRGVLLPGAPDFVTLFLIIRHSQLHNIKNFEGNYE